MELKLKRKRELTTISPEGIEEKTTESADYTLVDQGNDVGNISISTANISINVHSSQFKIEKLNEEALQEFINSLID